MKRIFMLLALVLTFAMNVMAEKLAFRTTSVAFATIDEYGIYDWTDWEKTNIRLTINTDDDIITIYSQPKQVYYIYDVYNDGEAYADEKGGQTIKFFIVDQDSDEGELRLRVDAEGECQIYIDFEDVAWVYNITPLE